MPHRPRERLDAGQNPIHAISCVHDAASQLTSVSDAYSSYAFGYNAAGWLTSETTAGRRGLTAQAEVRLRAGLRPALARFFGLNRLCCTGY
ncbi:MAG: RHS repeat domain-containing protein [Pirellulales bacterium]